MRMPSEGPFVPECGLLPLSLARQFGRARSQFLPLRLFSIKTPLWHKRATFLDNRFQVKHHQVARLPALNSQSFTVDNHILWCVELGRIAAPFIIDKIRYQ
jgi:hypothetical protein